MFQRPTAAPRFSWHSRFPLPKLISAPTNSCGRASICSHCPLTRSLDIARCSSVIRMEIYWRCLRTFSCREVDRELMRSNLYWLSDEQWQRIEPLLPTDVRGAGSDGGSPPCSRRQSSQVS